MMGKCKYRLGILALLLGLIFLLKDMGYWQVWGISAWTVVLLFIGLHAIFCKCDRECDIKKKK